MKAPRKAKVKPAKANNSPMEDLKNALDYHKENGIIVKKIVLYQYKLDALLKGSGCTSQNELENKLIEMGIDVEIEVIPD